MEDILDNESKCNNFIHLWKNTFPMVAIIANYSIKIWKNVSSYSPTNNKLPHSYWKCIHSYRFGNRTGYCINFGVTESFRTSSSYWNELEWVVTHPPREGLGGSGWFLFTSFCQKPEWVIFFSVLSFGGILTIVSEIGKTECIFTNLCVMQLLIYCKGGVFRYYILPVYGSDCKLAGWNKISWLVSRKLFG